MDNRLLENGDCRGDWKDLRGLMCQVGIQRHTTRGRRSSDEIGAGFLSSLIRGAQVSDLCSIMLAVMDVAANFLTHDPFGTPRGDARD